MANETSTEEAGNAVPPRGGRRKTLMNLGIILGVMLGEGVGVFFLARQFAGPPASAEGSESHGLNPNEGKKAPQDTEVEVVKLRAQNEKSQQMVVYDMTVAISISEEKALDLTSLISRKKATIQDRLSRVVRSLDPQRFSEPDLATLRQQFKLELGQILGSEKDVKEVLIPSIVKYSDD
jgi:flagellar basal body-associated protein FliL